MNSLLDLDLYKLTMLNVVVQKFFDAQVDYEFKCRNEDVVLAPLADDLRIRLDSWKRTMLTDDETAYLSTLRFFNPSFVEFMKTMRLDPGHVKIRKQGNGLSIKVAGSWWKTILWETIILSELNELYFEQMDKNQNERMKTGIVRLGDKIDMLKEHPDLKLADFGTRRRFSKTWHGGVVDMLALECRNFVGTSNVFMAMDCNIKPIGTFAHEYPMACSQLGPKLVDSQKFALQTWADVYRGALGIALSDTYGFDAFLNDFDPYFAKLFDGARHDSGDPFVWCEKLIKHYESMNIDPRTKMAVFSDGLTVPKAIEIYKAFEGKIKMSFGIGTNLTNDVGFKPLNIVLKMTKCNGQPVAKISDSPGKGMCKDENFVKYLKSVYGVK